MNSKNFRGISYILLPILVAILIFSTVYLIIISQNDFSSKDEYFKSNTFFSNYVGDIENIMNELIFATEENYPVNKVGDYEIYYTNYDSYLGLEDYYYLAIYEQKAITNVRKQAVTSIEELKEYILEANQKYFNVENGKINSNVEKFAETVEDYGYIVGYTIPYYTVDNTQTPVMDEYNYEEVPEELYGIPNSDAEKENRIYRRAYLSDFSIYTSYKEELYKENTNNFLFLYLDTIKGYENLVYLSIPISIILILIICVFLINSIGYKKDSKEIELADFDKIPLEMLLGVFGVIFVFSIIILDEMRYSIENLKNLIIMGVSLYFFNIAFLEIILVTIIKRIKAKSLVKTSLIGKICVRMWNLIKKSFQLCKIFITNLKKRIFDNISTTRILIVISIYFILNALFIAVFSFGGVIVSLIIFGFVLYQILLRIESFKKLEQGLKNIYEGNNKDKLNKEQFTPEFGQIVEYVNDISNGFENAVEKSLKSERLKTELITNVSHDIKTPLTSIINYVDLLKKEEIEKGKAKEYIEILDTKSQRLKKLIEDLVEASKASSGNVNLKLEKIGIIELIKQALGEFEDKFKEKNLEIIKELPKEDIKVNADSRYMYRVIENLFSNVAKYALEGSRVYIDVKETNRKIKLAIKNISKERLNISEEELMQRFVRGDKARTTEGSGLGLSIARSLIQLQRGNLECKIDGDLFKVEIEFDIVN